MHGPHARNAPANGWLTTDEQLSRRATICLAAMDLLGNGLGRLADMSSARTRSISPENFSGAGRRRRATEGTGAQAARDLGAGWKISPSVQIEPGSDVHARRHRRPRRDPEHVVHRPADGPRHDPAHLLGWPGPTVGRVSDRRFLRPGLGTIRPGQLAAGGRQPEPRLELLLADAVPPARAAHAREPRRRAHALLLPGQLRARHRRPRTRRTSTRSSGAPIRCPTARSTACSTA